MQLFVFDDNFICLFFDLLLENLQYWLHLTTVVKYDLDLGEQSLQGRDLEPAGGYTEAHRGSGAGTLCSAGDDRVGGGGGVVPLLSEHAGVFFH